MDAYIYQADLYCADCAKLTIRELENNGIEPSEDPDKWPQGPYSDGGGEADSPKHCRSGDNCLNADSSADYSVGCALENPLTEDGIAYVIQAIGEGARKGKRTAATEIWAYLYEDEIKAVAAPKLDKFTSIGCYTLVYRVKGSAYRKDGVSTRALFLNELDQSVRPSDLICADCAGILAKYGIGCDVDAYYEGAPIECAGCEAQIESSYGDPEANEADDQT